MATAHSPLNYKPMESYLIELANLTTDPRNQGKNMTIMVHNIHESDIPQGWHRSPKGQEPITYRNNPNIWGITVFIKPRHHATK